MNNTPKMRAKSCQRPARATASKDNGFDIVSTILDWKKPTKIMGLDNRAPLTSAAMTTKTATAGPGATSPNYENRPPQRSPVNYGFPEPHGAGTKVHHLDTSADPRLQRRPPPLGHPSTSSAAQQRLPSTKANEWKPFGPPPLAPSTSVQQTAVASPTLTMSPDNESNASVPSTPANPDDHSTCAKSILQLQGRVRRREEHIAKLEEENQERKKKESELRQRLANNEKHFISATAKLEKEKAALLQDQKSAQDAAEAKAKELRQALEKLEDENMDLQVAKNSFQQKAASLQHRLDAMTREVESVQQAKKDVTARCESLESANAQLTTDGEALREQVKNITKLQDQASKRAEELQKKVDELTQKVADAEEAAQLAVSNMMQTRNEMEEQATKSSELTEQFGAQRTQLQLTIDAKKRAEERNETLIQQLKEVSRRMQERMCLKCLETEQHSAQLKSENGRLQKALAEEQRSNEILREQFKALDLGELPPTSGAAALPPDAVARDSDSNAQQNANDILPTKKRAVAGANDTAPVAAMASVSVPTFGASQTETPRKRPVQVKEEAIQAQKSNAVVEAATSSEQQSEDPEVMCSRQISKKGRRNNAAVPLPKAEALEASEGGERSFNNATTAPETSVETSPEQGPATSCGAVPPTGCAQNAASHSEIALPVAQQQPQSFPVLRERLQPSVDMPLPWPHTQLAPYFTQYPAVSYSPMFQPQFQGSMASSTAMHGPMVPSMGPRMGAAPQMPQATFGGYENYCGMDWVAMRTHHMQQHPAAQQYQPQYPQPTMGMPQQQQMTQTPAFMQQQQMGAFVEHQHQPRATNNALSPQQREQMRQIAQEWQQLSPPHIGLATAAQHLQQDSVNSGMPPPRNAPMRQYQCAEDQRVS